MEIKKISLDEFKELVESSSRRAPYGQNQSLLKKAESEAMQLSFENERKAISKLTALYVVRRKMGAQVKIVRRANTLFLGPGEYVPTMRQSRTQT
jgi:hypothetical protein